MKTRQQPHSAINGGEWLFTETNPRSTFIPEDFSEEQKMILEMCHRFTQQTILPNIFVQGKVSAELMRTLIKNTAEQGLLFAGLPEEYGGAGKDYVTNTIIVEGMSVDGSYTVSNSVHASLGTMPIVFFGTEEQKAKY